MELSQKQIREILDYNTDLLNWEISGPSAHGQYRIKGSQDILTALYNLSDNELFKDLSDEIIILFKLNQANKSYLYDKGTVDTINEKLNILKTSAINTYNILTSTIPNEDPNSINIKLPPVHDFNDLAKYSKDFHTVLSQLIHSEEIDGDATIQSVENGSIWINVFVKTPLALSFVAGLVWSSAVIYKKLKEVDVMEQHIRTLEIKNETLVDLQSNNKKLLNQMVELEASHIQKEFFPESNPEKLKRIKHSINLLSELIFKGAEVQPSIDAPESVSNLFPEAKNMLRIESKVNRCRKLKKRLARI